MRPTPRSADALHRTLRLSLWLGLTLWLASPTSVHAEPNLDPRVAVSLAAVEEPAPRAVPSDITPALSRDVRLARAMLMAGAGLLAGSAVTFATLPGSCNDTRPMRGPLIVGGVSAGVAAAMLLGGGIKLALVPREQRRHARPLTGARLAGLILGALAIGGTLLLSAELASGPEAIACD